MDTRNISWNKIPDQPGAYTAYKTSVCKGQTGVTFTVPNDAMATTYIWSYTGTGASISGSGNSVTVDFATNATSGKLKVTASNSCGASALTRDIDIVVNGLPVKPILAVVSVCAGDTPAVGITNGLAGYTYLWSVTTTNFSLSSTNVAAPVLTTPNNDTLFPVSSGSLESYPDVTVVITDSNGCSATETNNGTNKYVTIHRIPRTGPPYHVGNNVAK